ncbi:hypothetical protein D3C71_1621630 [compost metagenome]
MPSSLSLTSVTSPDVESMTTKAPPLVNARPCSSFSLTVTSVWLVPSAGSDASAASIVLVSADGAPATNCTLAVDASGTPLILALTVAVPISVGAVRSAVSVPSPLSVTELTVPNVEVIANGTPPFIFFTSLPYASLSFTVTTV